MCRFVEEDEGRPSAIRAVPVPNIALVCVCVCFSFAKAGLLEDFSLVMATVSVFAFVILTSETKLTIETTIVDIV